MISLESNKAIIKLIYLFIQHIHTLHKSKVCDKYLNLFEIMLEPYPMYLSIPYELSTSL